MGRESDEAGVLDVVAVGDVVDAGYSVTSPGLKRS